MPSGPLELLFAGAHKIYRGDDTFANAIIGLFVVLLVVVGRIISLIL